MSRQHRLVTVVHLPRLHRAFGNDVYNRLRIEAGRAREIQPFRKPFDHPGKTDLVDHLGELARSCRPQAAALLRIGGDHRLGLDVIGFRPAAHDGELAVLGALFAARHRGIDEAEAACVRGFAELACDGGRRRGVVDEHRTFFHRGEGPAFPQRDGAQVRVASDAGHDDVRFRGGLGRRSSRAAAMLARPALRLVFAAVVDRHLMSGADQMAGHRITHHAQTDERRTHYSVPSAGGCPFPFPLPLLE